jgi:hypothetical protein
MLPPSPVCDETVIAFVEFVSPLNRDLVQEFYHLPDPTTQIGKHVTSLPRIARGAALGDLSSTAR